MRRNQFGRADLEIGDGTRLATDGHDPPWK
jgi:hypothetical protein